VKMKARLSCPLLMLSLAMVAAAEPLGSQDVGPAGILRHSKAVYTSIALHVGTQLDIFTVLDPRALTVEEASAATNLRPKFLERLLYALAAAEMLTVEDGRFANTNEASRYLVRGKPDFMGSHVLVDPFLRSWMFRAGMITAESLRAGRAIEKFDYSATAYQDLLAAFRGTMPVAVEAGRLLAEAYDLSEHATVADVGGASGGLVVSVVRAFPHLNATVTDLPSVTPVAVALLKEQGTPEIDVVEWDVLEGPCRRSFDVVVLRALIQVLSPDQAKRALVNVAESVNPGGRIFVLGHVMDDSRVSPPEEVIWYLLNLNWEDHAGFYAEKDYRDMLLNAGFRDVQRGRLPNGDGVMTALKPDPRIHP
jgi:hypothetical protein